MDVLCDLVLGLPAINPIPCCAWNFLFSSPDSSGTYSFSLSYTDPIPVVTGNDNFLFTWGFLIGPPPPSITNPCSASITGCGWNVTWFQSATDLSINVVYGDEYTGFQVDDTLASVGSDGGIFPCRGPPTDCSFTGYWTTSSVPIPEPSSLVGGLASAILGFFLIMLRRGGRARVPRASPRSLPARPGACRRAAIELCSRPLAPGMWRACHWPYGPG
jgi:hypothetical protein